MNIRLVEPTLKHMPSVMAYERAFGSDTLHGSGGLAESDYLDWLDRIESSKTKPPKDKVRSLQYVALDENDDVVGMIQLRLSLNDYLENYGGHIGYSVHPAHRGKGYATEMLRQVVKVARQHSLDRVLITCDQDNPASAKVIIKAGGRYEDSRLEPGAEQPTDRYWIETGL